MRNSSLLLIAALLLCLAAGVPALQSPASSALGLFEAHGDVGVTPRPGSAEFSAASGEYRITGGGANMWGAADAFHFAWRRVSGDVTVTADIQFIGAGAVAHRKAVLIVRQDLSADAAYADAALHGDGLTSLQYRTAAGGQTLEVQAAEKGPVRLRLERRGNQFTMYTGKPGEELKPAGPVTVALKDPVYVGIGVCSHDANILETALFSNVRVDTAGQRQQQRYRSMITIFDMKTKATRTVFTADEVWEAPNWTHDGRYLLVNSGGAIYRLPADGPEPAKPEKLNIDPAYRCNNDHGPTRDGKLLAFSASSPSSRQSQIFVANSDGSNARLVTPKAPSYFHGWSPDGKWLTYVANRGISYDVYRVAAAGGEEEQLNSDKSYEDGPEYTPDGKWIYYNTDRSGGWDIWRMPASGAGPGDAKAERITSDAQEDWFPHISPNGKSIVFLSFPAGIKDHNGKMDIELRMIPTPGRKVKPVAPITLIKFFGGQGTINVNSWSPDSKKFAFVAYEPLPR